MSVMFVGAIVALVFSDGPWRFAAFAAVGNWDVHPVDRSAARYRVFLPGEIEIGFGPFFGGPQGANS
jgi:hypothetical protein